MFLTRKSKRAEMLEVAEQQLSKWLENKARPDILEGVISGISQHIKQSHGFKKKNLVSFETRPTPAKMAQRDLYQRAL